jgi:hypothetical protein
VAPAADRSCVEETEGAMGSKLRDVRWLKGLTVAALVSVIVASMSVAYGAINNNGVVKTCYNGATKTWRLVDSAVACAAGETTLQFYTKARVDALLATRLTKAAADGLYLPLTNCISFPHRGIDWSGCDVRAAFLKSAVFQDGNLSGTNFTEATLAGANLRNVNGAGASFWGASLSGALMEDSSFVGADFRVAILSGAALSGADLTDANLSGADMTTANVGLVTWSNTICPDGTNSDGNGGTCVGHLTPLA